MTTNRYAAAVVQAMQDAGLDPADYVGQGSPPSLLYAIDSAEAYEVVYDVHGLSGAVRARLVPVA